MIKPTVGRVLYFYQYGKTQFNAGEQPEAAILAYVHSDTMVNLSVFDHNGVQRPEPSTTLVQEGDVMPEDRFCAWMPYQVGQAKKTEELEKKLETNTRVF